MVRGVEGNEMSTPRSSQKKQPPSSLRSAKGQKSILGFFQKKSTVSPSPTPSQATPAGQTPTPTLSKKSFSRPPPALTPVASSDAPEPSSPVRPDEEHNPDTPVATEGNKENGLPSRISAPGTETDRVASEVAGVALSSPSRKGRTAVNYAESDEDKDDVLGPIANNSKARATKRRRVSVDDDSDDEFGLDAATQAAMVEDDMDDFIAPDDSDEEVVSKKRKRPRSSRPSTKDTPASSPPQVQVYKEEDEDCDATMTGSSTAQQWVYDPENPMQPKARPATQDTKRKAKLKERPSASEPEKRYPWLANMLDADRNPTDHPDYDPRTLYIPPHAWDKFSPFEKQYWEIKCKFWDSIVFFKKGKFYELYEKDASVGHQLFDLKLTDRVNMRMVGVPEASLDMWASQFVAKGYKVARVDQMESALAKEMRERGGDTKKSATVKKADKVIRRELASVLTSGTLVDTGMLQNEMATYCMAIKEIEHDGLPAFGIAFVDTATAQFQLCEFIDDVDMTKLETLIAQMRPGELLVEKSCISAKALRILKNNTPPTALWNWLKPTKEFWPADITIREVEIGKYFESPTEDNINAWPSVLREAREQETVMSAFGALLQYLRTLKIERDLVTLGNFQWYDPIRKATSLVLDGQSLINLEIFANNFDGSGEGTLFAMLNRCITPFGKRLLRQWVCHPLADAQKINARLDAVDALNADSTIMDNFSSSLSKLPDLERLISRVHAGRCKAQDFLKVLEGFEQIEYTISLLQQFGDGEGVIGQLIASMPDLAGALEHWKTAFDRKQAKDEGIMVPAPGVEDDFDESQKVIDECLADLETLLKKVRKELGNNSICYRDNGKEIYQLEVPKKTKVPSSWDQMSATAKVTRYYSPELRKLVRALQEATETHSQITKEVATRFCSKFDEEYATWLAAVKIIAQLDCLISLAKASASLGEPSCRPTFTEDKRSVVEFEELRHPCMLNTVDDFIPNDIRLGGESPNISLLTGANAAGKSTILRMTCIAVILAQVGCYLPCTSAKLTPVDRIMSRLGANDNIFAAQSTFFVELAETQKILSEATPRSLVILDELGRGTSSYDGVAVAQAVLHDISTRVGCVGFFATHYRSLAKEFETHPEVVNKRMRIHVDGDSKSITFLYKLEEGVAEGSFGMHCAAMCGIPNKVIENAEKAAREWEHTSRLGERMEINKDDGGVYVPLGLQSDVAWTLREGLEGVGDRTLEVLLEAIAAL